jgi:radical SAM superfamily enzyme YgiQ (UPF0313 family)
MILILNPAHKILQPSPPLHLMYYTAFLRKMRVPLKVLDMNIEFADLTRIERKNITKFYSQVVPFSGVVAEVEEIIKKTEPLLTVIPSHFSSDMCIWFPFSKLAAKISERVKRLVPSTKTVIVGRHSEISASELLRSCKFIDYVIRGHSEIALFELEKRLEDEERPIEVSNLSYRENEKVTHTPFNTDGADIDSIPNPYLVSEDFKIYRYRQIFNKLNTLGYRPIYNPVPGTVFLTSRGCPYKCIFCDREMIWGTRPRLHSPKYVYEMLSYCKRKFGIEQAQFSDPFFTIDRKRVRELCRLIGPLKLNWHCQTRIDGVDWETLKAMKSAGCTSIHFGVESFDKSLLNITGKRLDISKFSTGLKLARKAGIKVIGTFIVGLDGDSKENILQTARILKNLDMEATFLPLFAYKGAPLFDSLVNKVPAERWVKQFRNCDDEFVYTGNFPLNTLLDLVFTANNLARNNPLCLEGGREIYSLEEFKGALDTMFPGFLEELFYKGELIPWLSQLPFLFLEDKLMEMKDRSFVGQELKRRLMSTLTDFSSPLYEL